MAQPFEQMSELDQGIYFRQACDTAKRSPFPDGTDRETIAHAFKIFGVETPDSEVINSVQEVVDYQLRGVARVEVGPAARAFEYFYRLEELRR